MPRDDQTPTQILLFQALEEPIKTAFMREIPEHLQDDVDGFTWELIRLAQAAGTDDRPYLLEEAQSTFEDLLGYCIPEHQLELIEELRENQKIQELNVLDVFLPAYNFAVLKGKIEAILPRKANSSHLFRAFGALTYAVIALKSDPLLQGYKRMRTVRAAQGSLQAILVGMSDDQRVLSVQKLQKLLGDLYAEIGTPDH